MAVGLFDIQMPLRPLRNRIRARITEVLDSGVYILGPEVDAFERELADYLGVRHAVGVGNGTDAITIGLRALGVRPGDEVVVPSFTFYASAEAIVNAGARPVFCDVDPNTRTVTADSVRAALTPRTTAIVAVDLFGVPAPIGELRQLGLPVLEDAAQAAGASARRPTRGLAVGAGHALRSTRPRTWGPSATAVRSRRTTTKSPSLRGHFDSTASYDKQNFDYVGYNSRLDEMQAAILRVLLPELDSWCDGRRAAARAYAEAGIAQYVDPPVAPDGVEPAWHLYVATHDRADDLIAGLFDRGIEARAYYRTPLHKQKAMAPYAPERALPVTDELARTNLALPMSPTLIADHAREVVAALAELSG